MSPPGSSINQTVILELRQLEMPGQPSIIRELVTVFIQTTTERLGVLNNSISNKNFDLLKRTAHTLKSSSATLGAEKMSQICLQIESSSTSGNLEAVSGLLNHLLREFETAKHELIRLI